jgi:hypothetical protein
MTEDLTYKEALNQAWVKEQTLLNEAVRESIASLAEIAGMGVTTDQTMHTLVSQLTSRVEELERTLKIVTIALAVVMVAMITVLLMEIL